MRQQKLIWQIFVPFLAVTVLAVAAVTAYTSTALRRFYEAQTHQELVRMARMIAIEIADLQGAESVDGLCKRLGRGGEVRVTVLSQSGQPLGDSQEDPCSMANHADRPEFRQALAKGLGAFSRLSTTLGIRMMYVAVRAGPPGGPPIVVRAAVATTAVDQAVREIYTRVLVVAALVAVCAGIASWTISRRINRPIEEMHQIAIRFSRGELDLRVPVTGSVEIQALAGSLNEMARQLEQRISTITSQRREVETIFSAMVEGVIAVDGQGLIVTINQAAARFLGIDPDQVRGRPVREVIRDLGLQKFVGDVLRGTQGLEIRVDLPYDGGRSFQVHGAALPSGRQDSVQGAVIVLHDMTQVQRLESIRKDFVANVSHELKTPITSIKGFVEALMDGQPADPDQAQRYLGIVAKHADRLNAIIDDLLVLSRLEEERDRPRIDVEQTAIRPVLESAIELSQIKASAKSIIVELACDPGIQVRVNAPLLEQAVANLVDNAVKYSGSGSRVLVQVGQDSSQVWVSVQDHGIGIPAEHLSRVFERFYVVDKGRSRNLGGTGLGLAIVKHIVQVHGGTVEVRSQVGKGSTFTIRLPLGG